MKAFDLRGKRQHQGLRIEAVASRAGVYDNTLRDIERGVVGIDQETYDLIESAITGLAGEKSKREEVRA